MAEPTAPPSYEQVQRDEKAYLYPAQATTAFPQQPWQQDPWQQQQPWQQQTPYPAPVPLAVSDYYSITTTRKGLMQFLEILYI